MGRSAPVAWNAELAGRLTTRLSLQPLVPRGTSAVPVVRSRAPPAKARSPITRVPDWSTAWPVRRVGYVVSDMVWPPPNGSIYGKQWD